MITQECIRKQISAYGLLLRYDEKEEVFSDRNVFPKGCIIKMEKIFICKQDVGKKFDRRVEYLMKPMLLGMKSLKSSLKKEVEIGRNGTQGYMIKVWRKVQLYEK